MVSSPQKLLRSRGFHSDTSRVRLCKIPDLDTVVPVRLRVTQPEKPIDLPDLLRRDIRVQHAPCIAHSPERPFSVLHRFLSNKVSKAKVDIAIQPQVRLELQLTTA